MRTLSQSGHEIVDAIARRHGFSPEVGRHVLDALVRGQASMAQFQHPELGGSGQWMRGGMTMVGNMFDHGLKARVDALCSELATLLVEEGHQQQGGVSLFVGPDPAAGPAPSSRWWKVDLGTPSSTGAQNDVRYAYFPAARRLAIETHGRLTIHDTLDHDIRGFSQQQSHGATLSFSSQHGDVVVDRLPVVSTGGVEPAPSAADPRVAPAAPAPASSARAEDPGNPALPASGDVIATIEKLAGLREKGILTDEEFTAKKAELLSRL